MWRHLTHSRIIEGNRHQNNVNTERLDLYQQRNVSMQFDSIKANFLHAFQMWVFESGTCEGRILCKTCRSAVGHKSKLSSMSPQAV